MGSQEEGGAAAAAADEVVYLHGVLEVTVFEAEHLHNAIHGRIMEVKPDRTTCTPASDFDSSCSVESQHVQTVQ